MVEGWNVPVIKRSVRSDDTKPSESNHPLCENMSLDMRSIAKPCVTHELATVRAALARLRRARASNRA